MKKYVKLEMRIVEITQKDIVTMSINEENRYDDTVGDFF